MNKNIFESYARVSAKRKDLAEFLCEVHSENTLLVKDLQNENFASIFRGLQGGGLVEPQDKGEKITENTRIIFTDLGRKMWDQVGHQIEEAYKNHLANKK